MIKVIVCDDQEIVCQGLRTIINSDPKIEVVATAHDGSELLPLLEKLQPDLVLMDLKMPVMNGVQATQRIRQTYPQVKILILTTYDDDEWLFDAIRGGASGYLLKDTPASTLIQAIKGTVAGETFIDPAVAGKILTSISESKKQVLHKSLIQFKRSGDGYNAIDGAWINQCGYCPGIISFRRHSAKLYQRNFCKTGCK